MHPITYDKPVVLTQPLHGLPRFSLGYIVEELPNNLCRVSVPGKAGLLEVYKDILCSYTESPHKRVIKVNFTIDKLDLLEKHIPRIVMNGGLVRIKSKGNYHTITKGNIHHILRLLSFYSEDIKAPKPPIFPIILTKIEIGNTNLFSPIAHLVKTRGIVCNIYYYSHSKGSSNVMQVMYSTHNDSYFDGTVGHDLCLSNANTFKSSSTHGIVKGLNVIEIKENIVCVE
jgi:hypothetical protein